MPMLTIIVPPETPGIILATPITTPLRTCLRNSIESILSKRRQRLKILDECTIFYEKRQCSHFPRLATVLTLAPLGRL